MSIHRSVDPERFKEINRMYPEAFPESFDVNDWLDPLNGNIMLVDGDNIGLATKEYPGVYTVHWFYKVRGREAIRLARKMLDHMFTKYGALAVRGVTKTDMKAARWASRQVGMRSYGFVQFKDGEHELFCMTKEEFYGRNR